MTKATEARTRFTDGSARRRWFRQWGGGTPSGWGLELIPEEQLVWRPEARAGGDVWAPERALRAGERKGLCPSSGQVRPGRAVWLQGLGGVQEQREPDGPGPEGRHLGQLHKGPFGGSGRRVPGPRLCPPKPGPQPCLCVLSSVSTIRNQRYHIHANLSFAVLVAQVLLLVSFHCQPGTVSSPILLAPSAVTGPVPSPAG